MGIMASVRRLFNLGVDDAKAWDSSLWQLKGWMSPAGETVTETTALTYSAVYNAVSLIAGTVSTLPLNLISRKSGRTVIQDSLPAHRVLHTAANEYMTAMQFRECQMGHLLLWGNSYAEIVRDGYGQVSALWPITPNRVKVIWADDDLAYEINMGPNQPPIVLAREQVLHVAGLGFDGIQGYSVVTQARRSLGLGMAMETFGASYFSNGTHPGIVVKHPGRLSDEGHKHLREALTATYSGLGNAGRLMLLEDAMSVEQLSISPQDSQFLESRQAQVTEVARWFNLPPHKLKDLTRSSFSNIESEQISFVTDSILPWLVRLESNYNVQLLSSLEQRRLYYKHVVEGLMRGNSADRANFYARMWNMGAMSINDIREKEDMDPVEGGDTLFVPANMRPLEQALQAPAPQLPAPTEEPAQEQTEAAPGNGTPAALVPQNGKGVLA